MLFGAAFQETGGEEAPCGLPLLMTSQHGADTLAGQDFFVLLLLLEDVDGFHIWGTECEGWEGREVREKLNGSALRGSSQSCSLLTLLAIGGEQLQHSQFLCIQNIFLYYSTKQTLYPLHSPPMPTRKETFEEIPLLAAWLLQTAQGWPRGSIRTQTGPERLQIMAWGS